MGISLTPLASLCLGVVRGWINVARRGKGGQIDESGTAWTRLPAEQLRDQLAREFMVEVSTRSVQRALKELEEENQIRREQRWKHRYKRDYWYAVTENEEALEAHRPRTIAGKYQSQRSVPSNHIEPTRAAVQVLNTPLSKTQFSRTSQRNRTTRTHGAMPTPTESGTAGTRKETHMYAVERCQEYGSNPPGQKTNLRPSAPKAPALEPETSGTTGSNIQKRPSPQGFGGINPYEQNNSSNTNEGRLVREVWIGGRCHQVADHPSTAPIR